MIDRTKLIAGLVFLFPLVLSAQVIEPGFPFKGMTVDARELGEAFPQDNLVPRGLVFPLGHRMYALFDIDLLRLAAIWEAPEEGEPFTYGSISTKSFFNTKIKAGGGTNNLTKPRGTPWIATGLIPGVQGEDPVFHDPRPRNPDAWETGRGGPGKSWWSILRMETRASLLYRNDAANLEVQEDMRALPVGKNIPPLVERRVRVFEERGLIVLAELRSPVFQNVGESEVVWGRGNEVTAVFAKPKEVDCRLDVVADRYVVLRFPANPRPGAEISTFVWKGDRASLAKVREKARRVEREPAIEAADPWPEEKKVEVRPVRSLPGFELEAVPLIEGRPFRPTSVSFHEAEVQGKGVVATIDGDLWAIQPERSLRAERGKTIEWKKIASGLNEPHCAFMEGEDGRIRYFDRNGFTLFALGGSPSAGIAGVHDGLSIAFTQSADTRDFLHSAAWSKRDSKWYFSKGGQQEGGRSRHSGRVLSITEDGSDLKEFACGLRNAYIDIDPDSGEIYAVDQQGHWVPTTPVYHIREGGYYGFDPARPHNVPTPEAENPLVFIPHRECQSAVDVVFTGKSDLGPLSDAMLVVDYFRPGLVQIFKETGAAVPLRIPFDVPLLKGAVNPLDGMLYLTGFQVWGSAAKELEGMVRMRATGEPVLHPMGAVAGKEGVVLTFNHPLTAESAEPTRYLVQRWNYKERTAAYGSGHYKLNGEAGQDAVSVRSVHLSKNGKRVFLDIPGMKKSQQLQVGYDVATADELPMISDVVYFSPFELKPLDLAGHGFGELDFAELAKIEIAAAAEVEELKPTVKRGKQLYTVAGCLACHSVDGSMEGKVGPTWKGLFGMTRKLQGGTEVAVDEEYLIESIYEPTAKIMKGVASRDIGMPSYRGILSESDAMSLVMYIKALGNGKVLKRAEKK